MNIPWEDLEVLLAVAEERSFSGAARRLSLTQPTVSRRIGAFEARLGEALFVRDVEGAQLTEAGTRLLPAAIQMARFSAEANQIASGATAHAGPVVFGYQSGEASDLLLWLAEKLDEHLPELNLVTRSASFDHLRRGEIDLLLGGNLDDREELVSLGKITLKMGAYASASYLKRWKKECGKRSNTPKRWLSPRENGASILNTEDHHMRARAAARGLGVVALPRLPYPELSELEELRGELAPKELYLWAHPAACALARTTALYSLLVRELSRTDGFLFTPKKGSPFHTPPFIDRPPIAHD